MSTTYPIAPHDQTEWDLCVRVAQSAPNTGSVPLRAHTLLAIDQALRDALSGPKQKPLTQKQIKDALADLSSLSMPVNKLIEAIVRATERAHHITG